MNLGRENDKIIHGLVSMKERNGAKNKCWRQKNVKSEGRRCDRYCYWYKLYIHKQESIDVWKCFIQIKFKMSSRCFIPLH